MTCLSDGLWTCETFAWAKRFKRRLWDFCVDVARELAIDPEAAYWPPIEMAIRLGCSVRQVERDSEAARDLGIMEPDSFALVFETSRSAAATKLPQVSSSALRMRRLRERRQRECDAKCDASHSVTQASHLVLDVTESASHVTSHSEQPTGNRIPVPESGPDIDYVNEPVTGPVPGEASQHAVVRMTEPRTVVARLVAEGMEQAKAEARLLEFGEDRCREGLEAVDYAGKVRNRAAWIVDFLRNKRPLPKRMIEARERAHQQNMPLVSSVTGGNVAPSAPPTQAVTTARASPALRPGAPEPPKGENPEEDAEALRKWREWIHSSIGDDDIEELPG